MEQGDKHGDHSHARGDHTQHSSLIFIRNESRQCDSFFFPSCPLPAPLSVLSGIWPLISAASLPPSLSSFSPTSLECARMVVRVRA